VADSLAYLQDVSQRQNAPLRLSTQ